MMKRLWVSLLALFLTVGVANADDCEEPLLKAKPAAIVWRTPGVIRVALDEHAVFVETRQNLRMIEINSGATIWTYSFKGEDYEDVPPEFVLLQHRVAIVEAHTHVALLARDTGERIAETDVGEWIRFLAGPPLLAVTQATNTEVSTLLRLSADGTIIGMRTVPRVDDVLIVKGVGVMESEQGIVDPEFEIITGYDLATLQTLWREKSFTFNKQVIGDYLYLGDIFWSTGAKVVDPETGVAKRLVGVRDPFQVGGSEQFDLQVVTTRWQGAWSPDFATCEGLRRNDSATAKTRWKSDLPFRVHATLRDQERLFVAGSRDANNRYLVELDWNTGSILRAWSGVPQMSALYRIKHMLVGFDLASDLVAIRIPDH